MKHSVKKLQALDTSKFVRLDNQQIRQVTGGLILGNDGVQPTPPQVSRMPEEGGEATVEDVT